MKYVLFDLDGTLTDPALGITNSIMYALRHFGITPPRREELYKFIGPPLLDSFMKYYGFDADKGKEAIQVYREYFSVKGLFENKVYDGIPEILDALNDAGARLIVATSKPEKYSREILEHFGLMDKFVFLSGNTMDETRSTKEFIIKHAIENIGIADPTDAIMVGDREYDVRGAKACGLRSVGVLYGYGSSRELEAAGADYITATVEEAGALLINLCK